LLLNELEDLGRDERRQRATHVVGDGKRKEAREGEQKQNGRKRARKK
jgi:hypothetical protein